jgi:hypothetical protein
MMILGMNKSLELKWSLVRKWYQGPFYKRKEPQFLVLKETGAVSTFTQQELKTGIALTSEAMLSLSEKYFVINGRFEGEILELGILGSKGVFNSSVLSQKTLTNLCLMLPKEKCYQVNSHQKTNLGSSFVLRKEDQFVEKISLKTIVASLNPRKNRWLTAAFVLHILLILSFHLYQSGFSFLLDKKTENAPAISVELTPEEQKIEILAESLNDFSGSGISLSPTAAQVEQVQKSAEKISNNVSKLVQSLSGLNLSGVQKNNSGVGVDSAAGINNTVLNNLKGKFGAGGVAVSGVQGDLSAIQKGSSLGAKWSADTQGRSVSEKDLAQVAEVFKSMQDQFRACYENALFKDDALSVVLHYEAEIDGSGKLGPARFSMNGKSTPESERLLKSCLEKELRKPTLSKALNGIKVKNQFVFRS